MTSFKDDQNVNFFSFQKSCIDFAIQAKPLELYVPPETTGIRYHIWRLVTSQPFENFIMLLILMNTILLMLKVNFSITSQFYSRVNYCTKIIEGPLILLRMRFPSVQI